MILFNSVTLDMNELCDTDIFMWAGFGGLGILYCDFKV